MGRGASVRTHVTFRHPAPWVVLSDDDGILSIDGAGWFIALLQRIEGLTIATELIQEDWGVLVPVARAGKSFFIGLSFWVDDGDHAWLAHASHDGLLQRLLPTADGDLRRLLSDLHQALATEPAVSAAMWYAEKALMKWPLDGAATPDEA